jgi:hypothetical protein
MHYYLISALIFSDGQVRDGVNCIYRSEKPSNIIDFRKHVAGNYAGPPDTYSAIIIPMWQEISEDDFKMYGEKFSEIAAQHITERNV